MRTEGDTGDAVKRIRVFVFDHQSGFDWRYAREDAESEVREYAKAGWLHIEDSPEYGYDMFCSVVVEDKPNATAEERSEFITKQLEHEDWRSCTGFEDIGFDWLKEPPLRLLRVYYDHRSAPTLDVLTEEDLRSENEDMPHFAENVLEAVRRGEFYDDSDGTRTLCLYMPMHDEEVR